MRIAHTADCHLGGHREPALRELGELAFARFVSESIAARVDMVLIAGDLFNTAIPGIDTLKTAVTQLSRLRQAGIPVYAIGGSHDASPNGKSMLDVLERANLLIDIGAGQEHGDRWSPRIVTDARTRVRITGIPGRQGMLDHELYTRLERAELEQDPANTILLLHTAIAQVHGTPGALDARALPPGCRYYAGGHVHEPLVRELPGVGTIGFPGPLFPNSFFETETLGHGGYLLWEDGKTTQRRIELAPVARVRIDAHGLTPANVMAHLRERIAQQRLAGAILTLRIEGELASGSLADIDMRAITREASAHGARAVLRNTAGLRSASLTPTSPQDTVEPADVEAAVIASHKEQLRIPGMAADTTALTQVLLSTLSRETHEGEKLYAYRDSVVAQAMRQIDDAIAKGEKTQTQRSS